MNGPGRSVGSLRTRSTVSDAKLSSDVSARGCSSTSVGMFSGARTTQSGARPGKNVVLAPEATSSARYSPVPTSGDHSEPATWLSGSMT